MVRLSGPSRPKETQLNDNSESMQEAENSLNHLISRVERSLASDPDLQDRIDAETEDPALPTPPLQLTATSAEEDRLRSISSSPFEEDLQKSKVYQRLRPRDSMWSIDSSQRGSMALSKFSELTLGDLSIISVFKLPIWSTDISNAEHYDFEVDNSTRTGLQSNLMQPRMPAGEVSTFYKNGQPIFSRTTLRMHSLNMRLLAQSKSNSDRYIPRMSVMPEFGGIRAEERRNEKIILKQQMRAKARRDSERLRQFPPRINEQTEFLSPHHADNSTTVAESTTEPSTNNNSTIYYDEGQAATLYHVFAAVTETAESCEGHKSPASSAEISTVGPQQELVATTEVESAAMPDVHVVEKSRTVHEPAALVPTALTTSPQEEVLAGATEDYAASTQKADWRSFPICFYQARSCDDRTKTEGG